MPCKDYKKKTQGGSLNYAKEHDDWRASQIES